MATDWSELPKDLLHQIYQRLLDSPLYLLRFRSVCSSWRSSTSPSPPSISLTTTFSLSHRSLLLLTPPDNPPNRPWLIKLSLDPRAPARLFHPLSRLPMKRPRFPALDLLALPALDLGREFLLTNTRPTPDSIYMEKLVFLSTTISSSNQKDNSRFILLTIHVSGKLALFRHGDESWTVIPEMPTPYDDVCVFRGRLYGADSTGRTVTVRPHDASLALAADAVFGGDKKFLVESDGALLLVDMYLSSYYFCSQGPLYVDLEDDDDNNDVAEIGWERTVKFDVFRLDEEGRRWVELTDLGERVLFLGDDCAFSASSKDLGLERGNCVVFRDDGLGVNRIANGMGVFSLDDGKILPLSNCPGFTELFCLQPDWIRLH